MNVSVIHLRPPYLLFLGDVRGAGFAKTALGIAQWRPQLCAGQLRLPGCDVDLGLPDMDLAGARAAGVNSVVLGVAAAGGPLEPHWIAVLAEFARAGMDLVSGLHQRLAACDELVAAAQAGGGSLIDVRVPPENLPIASGRKRSGRRLLTVGTDCAVGKKYTALALQQEIAARGVAATFRATGQTGIMIAGQGIAMDAVKSDFLSGAAEVLAPDNAPDHWDVIEGQGSLHQPRFAGVSLGLLHGAQPEALVLCHDAVRVDIMGLEGLYPMPTVEQAIDTVVAAAQLTAPGCRCVGISVNTSGLAAAQRAPYLEALAARTGLPCVDPLVTGTAAIVDGLLA